MEEEKMPPPLAKTGPPHMTQVEHVVLCAGGSRGVSVDQKGVSFLKDITTDSKSKISSLGCKAQYVSASTDGTRCAMSTEKAGGVVLFDLVSNSQCGTLKNQEALTFVQNAAIKSQKAEGEEAQDAIRQTVAQRFAQLRDQCCALTPNLCVVGYGEKVVVMWDIRLTPKPIAYFEFTEPIAKVAISEDGEVIAAVAADSKVIAWTKQANGKYTDQRFEHMPPDEPSFLLITPDMSHILVGMSKVNALSLIDGMRYELKTRKPRCATAQGDTIFVGCENGLIQCVRFGKAVVDTADAGGVGSAVYREICIDNDNIHREIQHIAVTRDCLKVTAAMRTQKALQYLQWDLGSGGKVQARCVALKCTRDNDGHPPAVLKDILAFVLPVPEPELRVGQVGTIMAIGTDHRIPCIVLRVQEADESDDGQRYLRILSLPLCGPVEEGLEDYTNRNILVPASTMRPLSIHEMKETDKQGELRTKAVFVAQSQDVALHRRLNPDNALPSGLVSRALRACKLNTIEAAALLTTPAKVPNDNLDALMGEEED